MFWVNFWDGIKVKTQGLIALIVYGLTFVFNIVYVLAFPLILTIRVITPWAETEKETAIMWWVDAIELGLYNPRDPPTNMWEIEEARTQYINDADFPDPDEDEEEEAEE